MSKIDWKDIAIVSAAGVGILVWDTYRSYNSLTFGISKYLISDVDFANNSAKFTMYIQIANPLMMGVTVHGLSGRVLLDGHVIGTVNHEYKYYLSGKHVHVIPITVNVNLHDLGYNALQVFAGGEYGKSKLEFSGNLKVGRGGLVSVPVEIGVTIDELMA